MLTRNKRHRDHRHHHHHQPQNPMSETTASTTHRKPPTKLSLLVGLADPSPPPLSTSPTSKSPRNFGDGVVGLGIVAAMNCPSKTPVSAAVPARSQPIPIVVSAARTFSSKLGEKTPVGEGEQEEEDMELSESYTCVISHVGNGSVKKRVYFDRGGGGEDGMVGNCRANSVVFFQSSPAAAAAAERSMFPGGDFLSRCYLCKKSLHGLDIFMYRGERAFCSGECRCQQIKSDELRETFGSEALKPFNCSVSPCSSPLHFAAGLAAA